MVPVKLGVSEDELLGELKKYFDDETAEELIKKAKKNGMSAYGMLMVRTEGKKYNLFRIPGYLPTERSKSEC